MDDQSKHTTETSAITKKTWLDMPRAVIIGACILAIGLGVGLNGAPASNAPQQAEQETEASVMVSLVRTAKKFGITKSAFIACMESDKHLAKITTDEALVMEWGTPYNIVVSEKGNIVLPGALPYENFIGLIDEITSERPLDIPEEMISTMDPSEFIIRDTDHIRGSVDAPIKIFEYSDIDCPYCKSLHPTLVRLVKEKPETVAWIYRHHPLDGLHPFARIKAEATECVAELSGPEAFWNFIDILVK